VYTLCLAALVAAVWRFPAMSTAVGGNSNPIPHIKVEKYQLANGLDVILSEDHRLPLVAVNIWYHVGWANERPGRTGFAHLFEHMMFQGSKHSGNDQHFKLLEAAGASSINGSTGPDSTNYFETLPANQLELALWIESDRMGYLLDTLDQEKLTGQIDVVRNERRESVENQPYGLAQDAVFHELFPAAHPYHGAGLGSHADIEAARLNDVREFFSEYYSPNNASLVIAGDFDRAQVKALVEKYFGPLQRGKAVTKPAIPLPTISSERRVTVTDSIELPRLYLNWLTPAYYQSGDADADLLATLLGGGKSSRLYKKLVYELQIAQDVSSYQYSMAQGSLFAIEATAKPGRTLAELEGAIDAELAKLRASAPTDAEVQRARNRFEYGMVSGLQSITGLADQLNNYNHHLGNPESLAADIGRYRAATAASIQAFAQRLTADRRVVVLAMPGKKVIDDVPRRPVAAVAGAEPAGVNADAAWRAQQPPPAATVEPQLPVAQQFKLANGLTVLLLEQHQLPLIAASLVAVRGGSTAASVLPGLAGFTADMLDEGTESRPALQLADAVAQLGAGLSSGAGRDATMVSVSSLRKDAAAALELAADVALHPVFNAAELERVRNRRQTSLLQQNSQPDALANRTFSLELYGATHPYGLPEIGTAAGLAGITRSALVQDWRAQFQPDNCALVVSGDITASQLRALAEKYFGQWSGIATSSPLPALRAPGARAILLVDQPGVPQSELRIGQVGAARSSPDYVPLQVMNTILGGQFSSRINMNLRERHGYTYNAYSAFAFRRAPGPFMAYGAVRTDVTADAVREVFNEINGIRDRPVSAAELRAAQDSYARSLSSAFESTSDSAATLTNLYLYGLPLDYFSKLPASINAVTSADVQRVARQYLQPEQMVVVVAGDRARIMPGLSQLGLGKVELRDREGRPASAQR
jgi:zinc protease